ncbi:MAG: hypothetical protein RIN56_03055 [Sporomusaceae bacterium]|nr:hypothetical protein [Sporomusaceae bacterium]
MRPGKPDASDPVPYLEFSASGIDIYCHPDLAGMAAGAALTLEVERTIFRKKLVLYGIKMESH